MTGTRDSIRAWRVRQLGPPAEVLTFVEGSDPPPEPVEDQILIAVEALGLNFADALVCEGRYQDRCDPPLTPGLEAAGFVVARGDTASFALGDRVVARPSLPFGGMAELAAARSADVFPLPAEMPFLDAAGFLVTYQTAWLALRHRARLEPGESILVHAGAGALGSAMIQLALALGARVLCTAGGEAKGAVCRSLGAHVVIDHRSEDVVARVRAETGGKGVDVVVDSVGGPTFLSSTKCIALDGRLVVVGASSGDYGSTPTNHLLVKNYSILGLNWSGYRPAKPELLRRAHDELVGHYRAGRLRPFISDVVPLEEARDRLLRIIAGQSIGKQVVAIGRHGGDAEARLGSTA